MSDPTYANFHSDRTVSPMLNRILTLIINISSRYREEANRKAITISSKRGHNAS